MSRRTKTEMRMLREAIIDLAGAHRPCTVRQLYYLGIGRYWNKDTGGDRTAYRNVVRLVGDLREDGVLPWEWIADNTRWVRRDEAHGSVEEAMQWWAEGYRRDVWATQPRRAPRPWSGSSPV